MRRPLLHARRIGICGVAVFALSLATLRAGDEPGNGSLRPVSSAPAVSTPAASAPAAPAGDVFGAPVIELDGSISISPDGGELDYRWRQVSGPPVELSDDAVAKPRFSTNLPGVYEFELVVSANGLDSEPHLVRLEIERENLPPVAKLPGEATGQVGKIIEIDGTRSVDPEGERLSYLWRSVTPGLVIPDDALTRPVLVFVPDADGVFEVELVVSDGVMTSAPERSLVTIKPKPRPPVARAQIVTIPAETAPETEIAAMAPPKTAGRPAVPAVQALPGANSAASVSPPIPLPSAPSPTAVSSEVPPQLAGWENSASPQASGGAPARVADLSPVSDLVTVPSSADIPAVEPVSESLSATAQQRPLTPPPVARIAAPGVAQAGKMFTLDARDSYSPSGNRLEYLWRQTSGPPAADVELVFDGAAERFMPAVPGDYEFELIVSDQGVISEPVSHRVRILRQPDPPVAVVVAPTHALPGSLVKMDATRSYDAAGGHLTYRWRQTGGPAVRDYVIDERLGDAAPAFRPDEPGLYSFSLVVFNGETASNQVDLDIEVTEAVRRPPGLAIGGPERAKVGERLVYSAVATDATGWNLTYAWQQTGGPAQALSPSGGIRAMVLPPAAGRYAFRVAARDEDGLEVASAETVLEVMGDRSPGDVGAPYVSPPTPMRGTAEVGPRRVPELTPLPNTRTTPQSFPQPQARGGRGSRSAEVLQGSRQR